jgi:hypothetical protein
LQEIAYFLNYLLRQHKMMFVSYVHLEYKKENLQNKTNKSKNKNKGRKKIIMKKIAQGLSCF